MSEKICIGRDCFSTHFIIEGQSIYCSQCTVHYNTTQKKELLKKAIEGKATFSYARSYEKRIGQRSTHRLREWARSLKVKPSRVRLMMEVNNLI